MPPKAAFPLRCVSEETVTFLASSRGQKRSFPVKTVENRGKGAAKRAITEEMRKTEENSDFYCFSVFSWIFVKRVPFAT